MLIRGRTNILSGVSKLFSHQNFGVSSLTMNIARSPSISQVAVITGNSRCVIRRLRGRLGGLVPIVGMGELGRNRFVDHRLMLVGIRYTTSGETRVIGAIRVVRTGVISMSPSSIAIRCYRYTDHVGALISLLGPCNVHRVMEANAITVSENATSISIWSCD